MPKKISKKKKKTNKKEEKSNLANELWAVALILFAIFVLITQHLPNTTGFLGYWVIEFTLKNIAGNSITYLPIFLLIPAITLIFSEKKKNIALISTGICFFVFTITLELLQSGLSKIMIWPPPQGGGGIIGYYGLFVLNQLIGINGTKIALTGGLLLTAIIILNISVKEFLIKTYEWFTEPVKLEKVSRSQECPRWKTVVYFLFYKKVVAKEPIKLKTSSARARAIPLVEEHIAEERISSPVLEKEELPDPPIQINTPPEEKESDIMVSKPKTPEPVKIREITPTKVVEST